MVDELIKQKFFTEASRPCSLSPDQGECVKYNDCRYALVYGGFYVTEINTRRSKCSQYGREFICCEVKTIGKKPAPVRAPTTTRRQTAFSFISRQPTKTFTTRTTSRTSQTTHPTTRFTTLRTLAPQVLAVTNPEVFQSLQVDPLHHQNYQLFKYPKCGIIRSSDRVAYGNKQICRLIPYFTKTYPLVIRKWLGAVWVSMGSAIGIWKEWQAWVWLRRFPDIW